MDSSYDVTPASLYEQYGSPTLDVPCSAIYNLDIILRRNLNLWLRLATAGTLEAVHTLIEYMFNYIRFTINSSNEFDFTSRPSLNSIHSQIKLLEGKLASIPSFSEPTLARAERVEAIRRDILAGLEESERQRGMAVSGLELALATGSELREPWQPFFKSTGNFSSESERNFMTRLRNIHINARFMNITSIMDQLGHLLYREFRNNNIVLSEVSTDTALRSIIFIIGTIADLQAHIEQEEIDVVMSRSYQVYRGFSSINRPENLNERLFDHQVYAIHVEYRQTLLSNEYLEMIDRVEGSRLILDIQSSPIPAVVPVLEVAPENPSSAWRKKLMDPAALSAPIDENEVDQCSVCLKDNVNQINYAILNNCVHRFCVECITEWFVNRNTCPNCRSQTTSWTTKDHLTSALKQKQEQAVAGVPPAPQQ